MVAAGYHGKKSGRGFYSYTAPPAPPPRKLTAEEGNENPYGESEGDVDVGLGRLLLKDQGAQSKVKGK